MSAAHRDLAERMANKVGITLTRMSSSRCIDLVLLSTGTGMALAVADALLDQYDISLAISDLRGHIGFDRRVIGIDYIATAFPTLLVMWNGLRQGHDYPIALQSRAFAPMRLHVYSRGLSNDRAIREWETCGAQIVNDLWADDCLALRKGAA